MTSVQTNGNRNESDTNANPDYIEIDIGSTVEIVEIEDDSANTDDVLTQPYCTSSDDDSTEGTFFRTMKTEKLYAD